MLNIHKTTNYDQFKFIVGNRPVATNRVYDSVKENNKLEHNAIVVTRDNYVIDGQHRLDAARRLQVPIYYTVDPDATVEDIALYQVQTPWTMRNFLDFYKIRRKDYAFIEKMCETYDLFHNLTFVVIFCGSGALTTKSFKNGTYKLKAGADVLETYFANLHEIINYVKKISLCAYVTKNALAALMSVISNKDYEHAIFMRKLKIYPDNMLNTLKFREFKNLREGFITKLYNFNARGKEKKIPLQAKG